MKVDFTLNGEAVTVEVPVERRLLDVMREDLARTDTSDGCGRGYCGSCLVFEQELVPSCLVPAFRVKGRSVKSLEGLREERVFRRLEDLLGDVIPDTACRGGLLLTVYGLLDRIGSMTREEFVDELAGTVCHGSSYDEIYKRIESFRTQRHRSWRGKRDASRSRSPLI